MFIKKATIAAISILLGIWFASWRGYTPYLSKFTKSEKSEGAEYRAQVLQNLMQHLQDHHHFEIESDQIKLIELNRDFLNLGTPFLVFFSGRRQEMKSQRSDLFMMQAKMGANARPISFTPPRNLTQNLKSNDHLFAVDEVFNQEQRTARVLYGQMYDDGSCQSITYLNWAEEHVESNQMLKTLRMAHYYDRWGAPQWLTLRFEKPQPQCRARFGNQLIGEGGRKMMRGQNTFLVFSQEAQIARVDVSSQTLTPKTTGFDLISSPTETPTLVQNLQKTLQTYNLITQDEYVSLSRIRGTVTHFIERNLYELFIDGSKNTQVPPVSPATSILDGMDPDWYPPKIDVATGYKGEGEWKPVQLDEETLPYILKTFIRLDPKYPHHTIHLYALDMRRLGIHFVAGGEPTQRHLEGVGSGKIKEQHLPNLVAAINGGPTEYQSGIIQDGQVLSDFQYGQTSLVTNDRGRALFGRLDLDDLPSQWKNLRQSYAPLVDDRVIDKEYVPPQSPKGRLDHLYLTRSALGINDRGTLIYAWSDSAQAKQMAEALKLSGSVFAMSLASDLNQSGIAVYPDSNQGHSDLRSMRLDPKIWTSGSVHDFFYFVKAQNLPSELPSRQSYWKKGEGVWKPIRYQNVDPWIATSFLTDQRVSSAVDLIRIDGSRLKMNLALGGAHNPKQTLQERPLAQEPVARIAVGLLAHQNGLRFLGETKQALQVGKMTWGVNHKGQSFIGLWGVEPFTDERDWEDLIQGMTLLDHKQELSSFPPPLGDPRVALGMTSNGDLVIASCETGDIKALVEAFKLAEIKRAILLTQTSSSSAGHMNLFYKYQGKQFYTDFPHFALKPVLPMSDSNPLVSIDDAFIFTPKRSAPRAQFVRTFKMLTSLDSSP